MAKLFYWIALYCTSVPNKVVNEFVTVALKKVVFYSIVAAVVKLCIVYIYGCLLAVVVISAIVGALLCFYVRYHRQVSTTVKCQSYRVKPAEICIAPSTCSFALATIQWMLCNFCAQQLSDCRHIIFWKEIKKNGKI